jgi:LysR family transcriptional regulator, glycine cleavage system transcriptional activator
MAYGLPPLNWLRAFEASARHLSFAKAAGDLNLTPTAVSHQVRSLERHLRHPLFERLPRGLRLTEMGAAYLPYVRRAFEDLSATTTKLFGQSEASSITVRAPVSFLTLWLAPRLPRFQLRYPGIDILFLSTIWADAQPDEAVDIDIRFGEGAWAGYEAEPLMHDDSVVICPRHVATRGNDKHRLAEIARGHLIHVVGHENHWAEAFRLVGLALPREVKGLRVDNSVTAVSMAAAGAGSTIVLRPFAERAQELMPLHQPFAFELPVEQAHYLLMPRERRTTRPEVLLFRSWLLEEAAERRSVVRKRVGSVLRFPRAPE